MPFAGGMTAYPGRRRRPAGRRHRDRLGRARRPREWAAAFGCDERIARELVCAAVRETFEEAGVLLAGDPTAGAASSRTSPATTGRSSGRRCCPASCRSPSCSPAAGWRCARTCCGPFAHWITPPVEPRRYDTKFFAAALPVGQEARHVSGEADEAAWLTPVGGAGGDRGRDPADAAADDPHPRASSSRSPTWPRRWPARRRSRCDPISPTFEETPDGRWAVLPDGTRIRLVVPLPS